MRLARDITKAQGWVRLVPVALFSAAGLSLGGCGETNSFLNPGEPNIQPLGSAPLVKPILDTLDRSVEESSDAFANATDIQPGDLKPESGDYRIGRNDLVSVSIYDLLGEGTGETVKTVRVSESGTISLPFIKPVRAEGNTEQELEQVIRDAYKDSGQIKNARVAVTVAEARARTFSIQGNVGAPGQYQIITSDFRMLDALVLGHGPTTPGVQYAYVIRKPEKTNPPDATTPGVTPQGTPAPGPGTPAIPPTPTTELLEPPHSEANPSDSPANVQLLQTAGDSATRSGAADLTDPNVVGPATRPTRPNSASLLAPDGVEPSGGMVEGQTVPVRPRDNSATTARTGDEAPGGLTGFRFNAPPSPYEQRVIRVPIEALRNGELQYNIVIRPGDMIIVPDVISGEYYMSGHVARTGVYSLTGRKITLKMAMASAGGFDQEAIPGRTEIIRRVGANKEVFVRVDLDKVWSGEQPDIYLKPNDVVQVGTNVFAPFIASIRNGFRITYGFGFLYDRNFAPTNTNGGL